MIEKWLKDKIQDSGLFTGIEVHPIIMAQPYNYPAIIYSRISSNDEGSKDIKAGHIRPERWTFGCYATTIKAVRNMETNLKVTLDGISDSENNIQFIYLADVSSDFYEENLELFSVNVDFYIKKYITQNS